MYKRSPYSEADAARYVSQITDAVARVRRRFGISLGILVGDSR